MDRSKYTRNQLIHRRSRVHPRTAGQLLARGIAVLAVALTACGGSSPDLTQLAWLEGCWDSVSPEMTVSECWLPDGDTFVGQGRMDDRVYENTVIGLTPNGLQYVVTKADGNTAHFTVTRATPSEARFENPEHDSPKWIQYTKVGDDIVATIGNGTAPEHEWRFTPR